MLLCNASDLKLIYCLRIWCFVYQFIILVKSNFAAPVQDYSPDEDIADITFVSSKSHTRLTTHENLVISLKFRSSDDLQYLIELKQPNDLFAPEHLNITEDDSQHYQCLYSGTVTSSNGNAMGVASLSSCFHKAGFEGFLYLEHDHFYITPLLPQKHHQENVAKNESKVITSEPTKLLSHRVYRPKFSKARGSVPEKFRNDGLTVPAEDLKKARQQMIKDQNSLADERAEDSIESDDVVTTEGNTTKSATAKTKSSGKAKPSKTARVIELAVFTDTAFYTKWVQQYPQDTTKKMNQYILAMVNNMNYLYQQPSLGTKISFRLVNIEIQQDTPSGLLPSTTAEQYLRSFCDFAGTKDDNGAMWDHAMLITGLQLKDQCLGIAYTSTMCLRYWSCSLVEYNKGFETTFTAAHEIGHSLGMDHDGVAMNMKCAQNKFIMAAVAGAAQVNWSPCSSKNMENFLASGDPRKNVKEPANLPVCLTKRGSKATAIKYKTGKFPGRIYDVKKQCAQACAKCTPYIKNQAPYNTVCSSLHCKNAANQIIAVHPALEGTACGPNGKKMCRNGKCQ